MLTEDVWNRLDEVIHHVQKCPQCGRVRETNPGGIWQPWMDATQIGAAVVQRAEKRLCSMCLTEKRKRP